MKLTKKLATLCLGDLWIISRLAKRPVRVEALYPQQAVFARLAQLDHRAVGARLAKRDLPRVMKRIALRHLREIVGCSLSELLRLNEDVNRFAGQVPGQSVGRVFCVVSKLLFEDAQLAAGREGDLFDFVARELRVRIERPQRLNLVPEKLEAHRPGAGQRKHIEDAAAQGDLALLTDLRLRLVALILKPLDEVKWIDPVAQYETAKPLFQLGRREGALQEADAVGDDHRTGASGLWALGQVDERLQPLAQHVGMRQTRFVRQNVPSREKLGCGGLGVALGQAGQPSLEFLMRLLLHLYGWANHHDRPPGEYLGQNRGNKGFAALANPVERQ